MSSGLSDGFIAMITNTEKNTVTRNTEKQYIASYHWCEVIKLWVTLSYAETKVWDLSFTSVFASIRSQTGFFGLRPTSQRKIKWPSGQRPTHQHGRVLRWRAEEWKGSGCVERREVVSSCALSPAIICSLLSSCSCRVWRADVSRSSSARIFVASRFGELNCIITNLSYGRFDHRDTNKIHRVECL